MKKQLWKILALIICFAIAFAGCGGGDEPEEPNNGGSTVVPGSQTPASVDILNTSWSVEGIQYVFFDDYSVLAMSENDTVTGTFEWNGTEGTIYIDGAEIYFAVYSDGSIYMNGEDGYDYLMQYEGEYVEEEEDPNFVSTDEYDLYTNADGTYTFVDKVRNVSYSCPQWMTVITGGIGESTDGVIVADNALGYVIMDNLTNEWNEYSGSNEDFLVEYVDGCMGEFFTELYGDWEDLTYEVTGSDDPTHLTAMELNVWNDSYDIQIAVALKVCSDQTILAVSYFAPYDSDTQLQSLYSDVVVIGGPF